MGFSRQESWSGFLFPSPGDLPNPGTELRSPALQVDVFLHSSILAQRIPWTEEPGGLQSTVSQSRTRLSDFTSALKKLLVLTAQALMCKTTNFSNCFIHIVFTTAERMTTMSVKFSSHCSVIHVLETGLGEEVGYVC